jgi:AraC-like DNA-binding protein
MANETFLATFGLIGLRLLEKYEIDPQRFAQQVGIPTIEVPSAKTRLPSGLLDRAFERAGALISNPSFALRAAECWHPSHLGTLGYAWLSSGSLSKALNRMARFNRILGQRKSSRCIETPDGLRYIYNHGRGDTTVGHLMADFDLSLILSMCRMNVGGPLAPEWVELRRPQPENRAPYDEYFACPVHFGAAQDGFLLARSIAERPLPTSNHELAITFDSILQKQLAELSTEDLLSRCKSFLLQELTSGEPSDDALAAAMCMSSRTLQRKLADLGWSYRNLLMTVRYELALRYLDDPVKTVTDITFLLGFSEQSAFTRAFKRWSGKSPTEYREGRPAPL